MPADRATPAGERERCPVMVCFFTYTPQTTIEAVMMLLGEGVEFLSYSNGVRVLTADLSEQQCRALRLLLPGAIRSIEPNRTIEVGYVGR